MHKELGVKSAGTSPEYDQEIHNRPFYRSVPSCCAVNEALPSEANLLRAASVSTMTKTRHRNISDCNLNYLFICLFFLILCASIYIYMARAAPNGFSACRVPALPG